MKKIKTAEIVEIINSAIERNSDVLSEDEILLLQKAIKVLRSIENSNSGEIGKKTGLIAINLLEFFSKPEIMRIIEEWLKGWFNN